MTGLEQETDFLPCAAVWLEFAALHFPARHLAKLVAAVVKRLRAGADWPGRDAALKGAVAGVLARIRWEEVLEEEEL